ncbi:MAG: DEAD/DEAH box helicase [Fimbriimonadaceae bacterium]
MISVKPRLRLPGLTWEWVPVCSEPERRRLTPSPAWPVKRFRLGHLEAQKPVRRCPALRSAEPTRLAGFRNECGRPAPAGGGSVLAVTPPPVVAPPPARREPAVPGPKARTKPGLQRRLRHLLQAPVGVFLNPHGPLTWPGPLYPFQAQGVEALISRPYLLLADDMGLGKTIQVLAAIRLLFAQREVRTVLIVVPASLMNHWESEAGKWAPELSVQRVHGPNRAELWNKVAAINITSYSTCAMDVENARHPGLVKRKWDLVVLDEASKVKNSETKTARATKSLRAERRWALTGTPLENSLSDVFSILQFLDAEQAEEAFQDGFSIGVVRQTLGEIQLRRRKADVLTQLPPKTHQDVYLEPSRDQREALRMAQMAGVAKLRERGPYVDITSILALITRLKQICNHEPGSGSSPKLDDIEEKLEQLVEEGHRALIFSQYICETFGAHFLARRLGRFNPLLFHGHLSQEQRWDAVRRFNEDVRHKVLILSTKAGGHGLNLQTASYVFHFDRWWNPAVEIQAEDRAHRIGQTQAVTVYRYTLSGTIEARIEQIRREKEQLFSAVVDRASISEDQLFTKSDYLRMLGLDDRLNPIDV